MSNCRKEASATVAAMLRRCEKCFGKCNGPVKQAIMNAFSVKEQLEVWYGNHNSPRVDFGVALLVSRQIGSVARKVNLSEISPSFDSCRLSCAEEV